MRAKLLLKTLLWNCCLAGWLIPLPCCLGEDWPDWRGTGRKGQWNEAGLLAAFPSQELKPRWRVDIGHGYSSPTVANGRVFVMDRLLEPTSRERIVCVDEQTGKIQWTHVYACDYGSVNYAAGPRASVVIDGERAYAIGATGILHCLDVSNGKVHWERPLQQEYSIQMPIWGISASPLIVGSRVIVQIGGKPEACLVAFDKQTGQPLWNCLSDAASYSSPVLVQQAGQDVIVCMTGENIVGVLPESGKVVWTYPFPPRRMPIGIATPVIDGDLIFLTSFYDGSLLLKMSQATLSVEKVWQRRGRSERNTDALHSIISTPVIDGDFIYGVDSYGELRCLRKSTGDRVWEDKTATPPNRWSTIHFVRNGDRYWMFNEAGELLIAQLTPNGLVELSRTRIIAPTKIQHPRGVVWTHPAFANRHIYIRNDEELICTSLASPQNP